MSDTLKVSVDSSVCQGHGRCWQVCPEVFDLDDEGFAVLRTTEVPADLEAKARTAQANCPERAIGVG